MNKKENDLRVGFHSIESILSHNPQKIKKVFLPANRADDRINKLVTLMEKNDVSYESSNKIKQEPEATISPDKELDFKNLKDFLDLDEAKDPLILILDNIIDPRNLGACIRSAAVIGVDAMIINKHQCAPINAVAHKVSVGGAEAVSYTHLRAHET